MSANCKEITWITVVSDIDSFPIEAKHWGIPIGDLAVQQLIKPPVIQAGSKVEAEGIKEIPSLRVKLW